MNASLLTKRCHDKEKSQSLVYLGKQNITVFPDFYNAFEFDVRMLLQVKGTIKRIVVQELIQPLVWQLIVSSVLRPRLLL